MKIKNMFGIITLTLQSILIVLMLVNIGYCLCTSQIEIFVTTIFNTVFFSFANYFETGNLYDFFVFLILLIYLIALTVITVYALIKDESTMAEWLFVLNGCIYLSDMLVKSDILMFAPSFFLLNPVLIGLMLVLTVCSGIYKSIGERVYVNTGLITNSYYESDKNYKNHEYECNRVLKNAKIGLVFQSGFFYISLFTRYYDVISLPWVIILYAIGFIISVLYLVTSFLDYRKHLSKYDFFDERTEKVEKVSKYVKCEGISLVGYILSGVIVFLF